MIASNSRARKGGKNRGKVKRELEERNADYGGRMQPSKQHIALCVKKVEWGLGTRGLGMVAAFWAGITVSTA